jgi:hypothetical protein
MANNGWFYICFSKYHFVLFLITPEAPFSPGKGVFLYLPKMISVQLPLPLYFVALAFLLEGHSLRGTDDSTGHFKARIPSENWGQSFAYPERLLRDHPQWTYRDLQMHYPAQAAPLARQVHPVAAVADSTVKTPLGISASTWGYCLMPAGVWMVYRATEDPELTKEARSACGWSAAFITGLVAYLGLLSWQSSL